MLLLHPARHSRQHALTLAVLTRLHHRYGRPVQEHEIADELDVLVTGDELPPPVDVVLGDLRAAGLSVPADRGWAPVQAASAATA